MYGSGLIGLCALRARHLQSASPAGDPPAMTGPTSSRIPAAPALCRRCLSWSNLQAVGGLWVKSSGLRVEGLVRICIMGLWVQHFVVGLHLVRELNCSRAHGLACRFSNPYRGDFRILVKGGRGET